MSDIAVTIEGMPEIESKMQSIAALLGPDVVEPILLEGAEAIAADIRNRAPVGPTGNLRRGVRATRLKRLDGSAAALAGMDFRIAPHAHLVEFGTVRMQARPFVAPAKAKVPEVTERIQAKLISKFEEAWNK